MCSFACVSVSVCKQNKSWTGFDEMLCLTSLQDLQELLPILSASVWLASFQTLLLMIESSLAMAFQRTLANWWCKIFTVQMRFLSPGQECHSSEGIILGRTELIIFPKLLLLMLMCLLHFGFCLTDRFFWWSFPVRPDPTKISRLGIALVRLPLWELIMWDFYRPRALPVAQVPELYWEKVGSVWHIVVCHSSASVGLVGILGIKFSK